MPDDEPTPDREDDGPVFTGFGIGSAVLGVLAVAAVALGVLTWTQHRSDVDEPASRPTCTSCTRARSVS